MAGRWVALAPVASLPSGGHAVFELEGRYIAVYHVGGEYHAIEDQCTHDGESLDGGEVVDHEVICPRHGARFCLRTGAALSPPAYAPVTVYPLRIAGDQLLVDLG